MQGEHKWGNEGGKGRGQGGEEDGCRSAPSDNGVSLVVVRGGRGSEREQSASWGRDIGVSNKQTTDTYKYIGCTGLFLNTHNVADYRSVTAQKHYSAQVVGVVLLWKIRPSLIGCESETLANWLSGRACVRLRRVQDGALHPEIKVSERVTIAHAGDLWCHCSRVTDRFVTSDKDYFIIPTAQGKMYWGGPCE